MLGFPGSVLGTSSNGTTTPTLVPVTVSSVRPGWGSGQQIQVQGGVEHGESGGPVLNSRGQVVGLVSYGVGETDNFMRTVDDIRAALTSAGIVPSAGAVDAAYRNAMTLYWNHHYTAAVNAFRRVLDLDATNPLAQRYLASAAQRAGTKADVPLHRARTAASPLDRVSRREADRHGVAGAPADRRSRRLRAAPAGAVHSGHAAHRDRLVTTRSSTPGGSGRFGPGPPWRGPD